MDYEKIEKKLRNFKSYDFTLEMLAKKLDRIKMNGVRDITAVDFSKVGHGSGGSPSAEDDLIKAKELIDTINFIEMERDYITDVVNQIRKESEEQYRFIDLYYFNAKSITDVAEELGYSPNSKKTIYFIKKKVLEKCSIYGL